MSAFAGEMDILISPAYENYTRSVQALMMSFTAIVMSRGNVIHNLKQAVSGTADVGPHGIKRPASRALGLCATGGELMWSVSEDSARLDRL